MTWALSILQKDLPFRWLFTYNTTAWKVKLYQFFPCIFLVFIFFFVFALISLNENIQRSLWCPHSLLYLLHIMSVPLDTYSHSRLHGYFFWGPWMCHIPFCFKAFKQVVLSAWNSLSLKLILLLYRQLPFFRLPRLFRESLLRPCSHSCFHLIFLYCIK